MIGVGFCSSKVALTRIPGWEPESYAYHSDDGQIFSNTTSGKNYGPNYQTLDVVGCGVNFRTGTAFFTRNGCYLGQSISAWPQQLSLTMLPQVPPSKICPAISYSTLPLA